MSYIDTRDLANKIVEMREELADNPNLADDDPMKLGSQGCEVLANEIAEIETLEDEISEFNSGETMIPTDEWVEYAEEFARDIGAISTEDQWPHTHIDWKAAADELATGYVEVDYDGRSYYARSG